MLLAGAAATLAATQLISLILHAQVPLDQLLFPVADADPDGGPSRMSFASSLFLVATSYAFLMQNSRRRRIRALAQSLLLACALGILLALNGLAFGMRIQGVNTSVITMLLVLGLVLTSLATVGAPELRTMIDPTGAVVVVARWAVPLALLTPFTFAAIFAWSIDRQLIAQDTGLLILGSAAALTLLATAALAGVSIMRQLRATQAQHERLGAAVEASPNGVVIIDDSGCIRYVNECLAEMFGYSATALQGCSVDLLLPDALREKHAARRADYRRDPTVRRMGEGRDLLAQRADGSAFPVEICLHPLDIAEGRRVLATVVDISVRRQIEREREHIVEDLEDALTLLEQERQHLVGALEAMQDAVFLFDVDGEALMVNSAAAELLGFQDSRHLLRDLPFFHSIFELSTPDGEVVPPDRWPVARIMAGETIRRCDLWTRRVATGDAWLIRYSGRLLERQSDQHLALVVMQDLTAQRLLEDQLRQAQKMEAVGQLTGGIAHDFNNILTVIIGNAELTLAALPVGSPLKEDIAELLDASKRGAKMVAQLMQFARRGILQPRPLDLMVVIRDLRDMLSRLMPDSIAVELPEVTHRLPRIRADRSALDQIIVNLCTNARDAMPSGGRVRIECHQTELDEGYTATHPWVEPGDYLMVSVTDTGVGMLPEVSDKAFEPFYTTKPAGVGTGLGLAMVYGLMKQHAGMVHIYSECGGGTTVRLYFPVAAGQQIEHEERPETASTSDGNGELVLVAEDDAAIRRATDRALTAAGYSVVLAEDGEEALAIYRQRGHEIALVISDLVMPKLGGRQLAAALLALDPAVLILFTSGYSPNATHAESTFPPGTRFLHKPWTLAELTSAVGEMVRVRSSRGPRNGA